jgi:hypothetical protein
VIFQSGDGQAKVECRFEVDALQRLDQNLNSNKKKN